MSGHLGIKKTQDRITAHFFWKGAHQDIQRYCKSCDICQRAVYKGKIPQAPMGKMPIIDEPFKKIAIDLIGPIHPTSEDGYRYILTVVDFATRYPEAIPLKRVHAEDVAQALFSIFCRLGIPKEILTDQGTQFTAIYMEEILNFLRVNHLMTTAYHPQCNGMVEALNDVL